MSWNQTKKIFKYIIANKYLIRKDPNTNNILFISWKKLNIKCKYFLLFVTDETENSDEKIMWSCDNMFVDKKTQKLSKYIKMNIMENGINEKKFSKKLSNFMKKIFESNEEIEFMDEKINLMWVITEKSDNYKYYYVITEIIYL